LHSYSETWSLDASDPHSFVNALLQWSRETLASCRRPFGIDFFDLSLTIVDSGHRLQTLSARKLRPIALYAGDLADQIAKHLEQALRNREPGGDVRISAELFSWGDAAHAALPQA